VNIRVLLCKHGTLALSKRCPAMQIQENRMFKPLVKVAFAAAIGGLFVFATAAAPKANASVDTLPQDSAKGDRLHVAACSKYGWPNFEPRCQFDIRNPESEARTVRVIALR
jgi:hypothetical protein